MALLLGSDYTEGVANIGVVGSLEVVSAFPLSPAIPDMAERIIASLTQFKEWVYRSQQVATCKRPPRRQLEDYLPDGAGEGATPVTTVDDAQQYVRSYFQHVWKLRRRQFTLGASFPSKPVTP